MGHIDRCAAVADCDEVRNSGLGGVCVFVYVMNSTVYCMVVHLFVCRMYIYSAGKHPSDVKLTVKTAGSMLF